MEIESRPTAGAMVLSLSGRLDAHWAEQLDRELAERLQGGARRIDLEMGRIDYISSAGIRILLKYYKQLRAIQGGLRVLSPSDPVRSVLQMGGMLDLLDQGAAAPSRLVAAEGGSGGSAVGGLFETLDLAPGDRLTLRLVGRSQALAGTSLAAGAAALTPLPLPADVLAVGLGAFGRHADEGLDRVGEFMALGGAALCQPTDGSTTPDDQVAVGKFVPTVLALYAALCTGRFAHFFHFAPLEPDAAFPLSRLIREAISLSGGSAVGMAMIAETEGLVGAQLRRSPTGAGCGEGDPFAFPGVRDRIVLTPEPAYPRTLTLAAGIAVPSDDHRLAPFVRPLEKGSGLAGHFHAAALSFRALPGGLLDLSATVAELVAQQRLFGLFHLLNDSREITGIGESRFIRGAVWAGPLDMAAAGCGAGGGA